MKKVLLCLLALTLSALIMVGCGYYWLTQIYANNAATLAQAQVVEIAPGTSGQKISELLVAQEIIVHPEAFRLLSLLQKKNTQFKAGEYQFLPGITPLGVMEKLVEGDVIHHQITIPEGKTSVEIMAILAADNVLEGTIARPPAEGSLMPETYDFTRGTNRQALLDRMAKAQNKVIEKLWPLRLPDLLITTPQEAIILASIVEKETGKPEERPRVAAAYINRIKRGMMLQADPTVAYGVYGGQYANKPLTYQDLRTDTAYNTYTRTGLPAGPICHPGRASIDAVLHPLQTNEIYFVATGDGGHRFAETLEQHNKNVADYRKWKKSMTR